jgi:hypothetical protein
MFRCCLVLAAVVPVAFAHGGHHDPQSAVVHMLLDPSHAGLLVMGLVALVGLRSLCRRCVQRVR